MANQVEQELCEMYKKVFDENKDICDRCRGENIYLSKPLSAWLVGDDFCNPPGQKPRILFVGKNAKLRYSTIENWSKNMYNLNTKRAFVEEGGTFSH